MGNKRVRYVLLVAAEEDAFAVMARELMFQIDSGYRFEPTYRESLAAHAATLGVRIVPTLKSGRSISHIDLRSKDES